MRYLAFLLLTLSPLWLAGCDQLGIESAAALAAQREAEGKAIGAGCRHSARSVEQCYALNRRADKAAVFVGWKEMSEYMAANKIEAVPPASDSETTLAAANEAEEEAKKPGKSPGKKH